MEEPTSHYIVTDEHGVQRVAGTRISLESIVIGFIQGQSAEEIQRNFPAVSLEQVYGVITHYLAHRERVEAYLRARHEVWDRLRAESQKSPNAAVERLKRARGEQAGAGR